ncbi:protein phosphatase 2C domain-containing protein [Bailinhaonella thermotolerans]|uniref:protein phosphatase 2C domain-containing protein n=1 Tax=Bailinhaonella thermotolerans TaxID=1070861 RepID=UPI001F5B1B81|nr:protein phosphatase 2C domain-containing protein [Bailinhaonella thermotolerans]
MNTCTDCGGAVEDGYCAACGLRAPAESDHVEIETDAAAAVSDRGHRHSRNEDAMALSVLDPGVVAVVCDGVSSSPRPEVASGTAARTGARVLAGELRAGRTPEEATRLAALTAAEAVKELAPSASNAPACTYVSAFVSPAAVTVGWVGDSRAYWLAVRQGAETAGESTLPFPPAVNGSAPPGSDGPAEAGDPRPAGSATAEIRVPAPEPAAGGPADPEPVGTEPVGTEPVDTEPVDSGPADAGADVPLPRPAPGVTVPSPRSPGDDPARPAAAPPVGGGRTGGDPAESQPATLETGLPATLETGLPSALLTVDDSWGTQMAALGVRTRSASRNAHVLTAWLGADAGEVRPHVETFTPAGPGVVLVCSDGLWNYLPEPHRLAAAVAEALGGRVPHERGAALEVARALVRFALDSGGRDNVTVAVVPFPPPGGGPDAGTRTGDQDGQDISEGGPQ